MTDKVENRLMLIIVTRLKVPCLLLRPVYYKHLILPRDCILITEMGTDKRHKY